MSTTDARLRRGALVAELLDAIDKRYEPGAHVMAFESVLIECVDEQKLRDAIERMREESK